MERPPVKKIKHKDFYRFCHGDGRKEMDKSTYKNG